MESGPLKSIIARPRDERAHVVESLYGERRSFLVGGFALAAAGSITAWHAQTLSLWVITALMAMMTTIRYCAFEIFLANQSQADRHPRFWKRLYWGLGVLHLFIIGFWTTLVFWQTDDQFSQLLCMMAALAYLIGTQGRNFSSLGLVRFQLLACVLPMLLAFYAREAVWGIFFSLFLVAFYMSFMETSAHLRRIFRDMIRTSAVNWELAHTDALTGLPNRPSMQEAIRNAIAGGHPFALHFLDLDHFKRVNDTLGHLAGDQLLRQTATLLQRAVGQSGVVSRYSSDEFVILQLISGRERTPAALAEELLAALSRPVVVNGVTMRGGCSIGIAQYPRDAASFEALAHLADMALFEAKEGGRGRIVQSRPGMRDRAADRLRLESELRRALEDGSIELYYQPIVLNGSLKIASCEALVRWRHATRGNLSPGEFLAVAEEAGLMNALTDRTFELGCQAAAAWPETIGISINLSPSQLCRDDIIEMILARVAEARLDPRRLEIEVTEHMRLDLQPNIREKLNEISAKGIRLALDDFGTGYSNLGQIARLPFNKIKLDKQFLEDIETDERALAVLRGAVQFIAPLGLEIVLEGLETESQIHFALSEKGISHLQGYAFGPPMPAASIRDFLHASARVDKPRAAGGEEPQSARLH
ncbi:putative bifunctional diguanylate cyclase/phosphodiesterase [Aureimonas populi]|uniref:Bifunctional diguanylate cyclase/phosphodiesterase n=1 Tax=Aureimonas populi TaxID=1701758 RepID=A0ABW5CGK2_9HYPH|nr:EAL domain-containing protein [Aureimonas populi]